MTTNEIKTLIEKTIAGQGSQVDIGGKLAEILGAIVDAMPSGETPRPIVLTAMPEDGDTVETLAEKGLTVDEISAAARGERTGVVRENRFFPILTVIDESEKAIVFGSFDFDDSGTLNNLNEYKVQIIDGEVYVRVYQI